MAATYSTLSHRVMPVIEAICHSGSRVDDQYCSISKIMMLSANAALSAPSDIACRAPCPSPRHGRNNQRSAKTGIAEAGRDSGVLKKEASAAKEKPAGLRRRALVNSLAV
jgi:hypothetical protein